MAKKLTEPCVKRAVRKYLDRKGYMEQDSRELNEQGIDLLMRGRRNGRYIVIEAKGESRAKQGMENKLIHAMGQILTKFRNHPNYYHGLAVPYHWRKRVSRKLNFDAVSALNMVVYLVKENHSVIEVGKGKYRSFLRDQRA